MNEYNNEKVWQCRIGGPGKIPPGGDLPMRVAVQRAYEELMGEEDTACFSGWGNKWGEKELAVIENRHPSPLLLLEEELNQLEDQISSIRSIISRLYETRIGSSK